MSAPARHKRKLLWSRRTVLRASFATFSIVFAWRTRAAAPVDLTYSAGRLSWPTGSTRAAIGKGGVRTAKREGDLATPPGDFALLQGLYRADRVKPPATALQMRAGAERCVGRRPPRRQLQHVCPFALPFPC